MNREIDRVKPRKIVLAITGASGVGYGIALARMLPKLGHQLFLILSAAGEQVMNLEAGLEPEDLFGPGVTAFQENDLAAPVASGSFFHDGMVIAPCTMATLAAVARGLANNLIHRAADVTLKEGRPLILVPRETPLNRIQIENMLAAHDAGAVIMPAMPSFYGRPAGLNDLFTQFAGRILDRLGIANDQAPRWGA